VVRERSTRNAARRPPGVSPDAGVERPRAFEDRSLRKLPYLNTTAEPTPTFLCDGDRTSSMASDEQLERVVRRAIRAELERLAERLFWTLIAALGLFSGLFLVTSGVNGRGTVAAGFVVFGAAMVVAAIRVLLLKWELPPYRPDGGVS
jgi:hypothetical protein